MALLLCIIIIPFLSSKSLLEINSINFSIFVSLKGGSQKIRSNRDLKVFFFSSKSKISLERAIKIDPNYIDAYINLGLLNKDINNYNDAEKYYLKALELNNKSAIAHLNLGACYKEKLEIEKALFHTQKAIELNDKLENSYLNLATIYNQKLV